MPIADSLIDCRRKLSVSGLLHGRCGGVGMTQSPMHRKSQARQPQRLMGACRARVRLSTVQVAITSSALDQPTLQSLDHHESESPINRPGGSRRFQFLTLIFRPRPTNDWRGLPRLDTSLDDAMTLQQPVTGIGAIHWQRCCVPAERCSSVGYLAFRWT